MDWIPYKNHLPHIHLIQSQPSNQLHMRSRTNMKISPFKSPPAISLLFLISLIAPSKMQVSRNYQRQISLVYRELISDLNIQLKITAIVCWDYDSKFKLAKTMNNNPHGGIMIGFEDYRQGSSISHDAIDEHHIGILLDVDCDGTQSLLHHLDHHLFASNYRFFIIHENIKLDNVFHNLPILVNSDIFYVMKNGDDDVDGSFMINQIYRTRVNEPLRHENYGIVYSKNLTIDKTQIVDITSRRRQNLNKTAIYASLVITHNDTIHHLTDYQNKEIDTITKVNYLLTNYVADILNATMSYSYVDTWGYNTPNTSSWTGMIGQLVHLEADVGASPLFFTIDRIPVIEYIVMTSKTRSKFVFRSPKLSYTENVFILPFSRLVWFSLLGLVFVVSFSLFITIVTEFRHPVSRNIEGDDGTLLRPSLFDATLMVFSAACQQGSAVAPKSITSRGIMFLAYLSLMFLYTSYSANIVALLQSPSTKIKTLEDLYKSRLKFGVDDTVFNQYYFSHAAELVRKRIYLDKVLQKDGRNNFMTLEDGIAKMRNGLFAFHMELGVGYKLIGETFLEYEKCDLQEIQYLQVIDPYYAIQKNSSFKEMFKIGLLRIGEVGITVRENSRLYTKKPHCTGGGGGNFVNVGLIDTRAAIEIYVSGVITAGLLFILEILISKYLKRKHN